MVVEKMDTHSLGRADGHVAQDHGTATQGAELNGWLPLMDYAIQNSVSMSTLRRYIKAGKIAYRVENGRYLVQQNGPAPMLHAPSIQQTSVTPPTVAAGSRVSELEQQLRAAREEIAELKMLVALYEETLEPGSIEN